MLSRASDSSLSLLSRSLPPRRNVQRIPPRHRALPTALESVKEELYQQVDGFLGQLPSLDGLSSKVGSLTRDIRSPILDTVYSLLSPSPEAAEKLSPGFGTRLVTELLEALGKTYSDGRLDFTDVSVALGHVKETFEVLFPGVFGDDLEVAIEGFQRSLGALGDAMESALPVQIADDANTVSVVTAVIGFWIVAAFLSGIFRSSASMDLGSEYEVPKVYSPEEVERYFAGRRFAVWSRCLTVLSKLGTFYIDIQIDRLLDRVKAREGERAIQLRNIIEDLGPTYIKVAQSLSTRVDILSEKYFAEIERLQDRVPPFSSEEAYSLMELELGKKIEDVFEQLTPTTVASASLGQVYRGILREDYGGGEVAVKVQRPNVLSQVALDLYVARLLAIYVFPKIQRTATNYLALVDEYAVRFFQEMDYEQEAKNGMMFGEQMASIEGIVVPKFYGELSTRKVLISEWIEGEKLSESSAPDVRELCNTLLNVYLVQLLDTGFLHADPHPGNLIRTPGGKICIIDFGLMTQISKSQRDNLVEYIANLTTMNWKGVAYSLKALGFIDENSPDPVEMGLVEPLELIFGQIVRGGGADQLRKRIESMPRLDQVRQQLEDLSKDFPFAVPSFFTLILRCFSVIEGIALGVDQEYSIVMECFPYIARRLLTDNDPTMHRILKGVLYGNKSHIDIDRIERVTKALGDFTVAGLPNERLTASPALNATFREALEVLFSPKGSYVQDLLIEEMVAATDALSREGLSQVTGAYLGSIPAMVSMRTMEALGPFRTVVFPFLTPTEIVERLQPALMMTTEDEEALSTVKGIVRLASRLDGLSSVVKDRSGDGATKMATELMPLVPDLLPGMARMTELFVRKLISRAMMRMANALEGESEYVRSMEALE